MKKKYEFVVGHYVVASFTLYGDHDADTDKVLMLMLRESTALAKLNCVDVRVRVYDVPRELLQ